MTHRTDAELEDIIMTRINGNISDFNEAVKKLDSYDTARLISLGSELSYDLFGLISWIIKAY